MAWSTPSSRTTGELIPASVWNQDVVANPIALRTGGIAIASQAALDFIYASSASQFARLAKGSGLQYLRMNAGASAYEFATLTTGAQVLDGNSGSDTNGAATNVDTTAMASGLTALDVLVVVVTCESVTQQTTSVVLYNSTDGVTIVDLNGGANLAAGDKLKVLAIISQQQSGATAVDGVAFAVRNTTFVSGHTNSTFTTNWIGNWTLALRHGGVTGGGTFRWSWNVQKFVGQ